MYSKAAAKAPVRDSTALEKTYIDAPEAIIERLQLSFIASSRLPVIELKAATA
jgi:hypothetical protein